MVVLLFIAWIGRLQIVPGGLVMSARFGADYAPSGGVCDSWLLGSATRMVSR